MSSLAGPALHVFEELLADADYAGSDQGQSLLQQLAQMIGARHRAILTMIQVEGLVIAGASWVVALPLSVPMSVVLARAFGRIMIRVPVTFVPEPSGALRWLVVVVVVSLAACAWPAVRAMRVTVARALAYE